jgi:hypothetical protein
MDKRAKEALMREENEYQVYPEVQLRGNQQI